jgi:hypothetical protein
MFTGILVNSQITINKSDMPVANNPYEVYTAVDAGSNFSATGAGYIWDYTFLTQISNATETYLPMDSVPALISAYFAFPFSNSANLAQRLLEFPVQLPIPVSDAIQLFANKDDGFKMLGYGVSLSGLPLPMKYNTPDLVYKFPMNYNTTWSGNADLAVSLPTIGYYGSLIQRSSTVDGWGTLYLPGDTFEVLRISSTVIRTDSIYLDTLGFGFQIPPITTTEYTWLAKTKGVPVLRITDNGLIATATFTSIGDTTSNDVTEFPAQTPFFKVYPNPSSNFTLEYTFNTPTQVKISVTDLQGRTIETIREKEVVSGMNRMNWKPAGNLPDGTYFIRFEHDGKVSVRLVQYQKN